MLDQMDEEFGVGSLVEEEVRNERRRAYRDKDLLGLKVEHDIVSNQNPKNPIQKSVFFV